jgi:hypothetical protein
LTLAYPRAQGSKSLTLAAEKMLSTTEGEVTCEFENRPRDVIYQTSALRDWKFAVGITLGSGASVGDQ